MNAQFPGEFSLECGPVGPVDLALFAAAAGDHNPLHLDADVAKAAGFERPVVHGMLTMAYAGRLLTRQFGAGSVRSLRTRFTGTALRGDRIVLKAVLQGVENDIGHYELRAQLATGSEVMSGAARIVLRRGP